MNRYTEYIRTRVTPQQMRQLKSISNRTNKPVSEITRELLERYIKRQTKRQAK